MMREGKQRRCISTGLLMVAAGPLLLGGCPDVREGVVSAFEAASIAVVADAANTGPEGVLERGLAGTLLRAFFDIFRDPATP
jgi:hypothetical protein